jgi:hypothetical protein
MGELEINLTFFLVQTLQVKSLFIGSHYHPIKSLDTNAEKNLASNFVELFLLFILDTADTFILCLL